ncbi:branched-chain-amino-acid aminotransferase [Lobosporangium transversale]|uniref:Branched-chain-amino-acid aminotransferase n=1 Tax=Lobosporangium transversale TaxID=64571 RepID=A0A1Y2GXH9_9FUNG|nr:aminotransferase [Lobosporangium transversale]KAF9901572.1 branched-chain-amino-acid aminotransferase [Lobosporangium transversale]ORZ24967.1 aminotransferase [Lobosporangium transversale]|eukprot:XP_021883948.1 aminotransferase [Lobosporangium transversale]
MFVNRVMRQAIKVNHAFTSASSLSPSRQAAKILSTRFYSSTTQPAPLDASKLQINPSKNLKALQENNQLVFGKTFTDNMLIVEWEAGKGWGTPQIKEYGKLQLEPSAVVFHYSFECFEGMKAYKDKNGKTRLFRPDLNMARFNRSAQRIALPGFDGEELTKLIKEFLKVDDRWIPKGRGYSLYLRPTMIGTQESLGVGASNKAMIFVIASPVGPYFPSGFNAVNLLATSEKVRAWPGGTGDAKIGGNYAPCIKPQLDANKEGFQQNLWLFGHDHQVTEVGTMNCFVYWKNEQGENELVTPDLDGSILPGVTRDSILSLARQWGEFKVSERKFTMKDLVKADKEGRIIEMFGAGTACIVCPIKKIHYDGQDIHVPLDPSDKTSQAGKLTKRINNAIMDIQYGDVEGPKGWSVVV